MGRALVEAEKLPEHVSQHWLARFVGLYFFTMTEKIQVYLAMLPQSPNLWDFVLSTVALGATFQQFPSMFCLANKVLG